MDSGKENIEKQRNPRETSNCFSVITFIWTLGMFRKGSKRDLEVNDLYEALDEHRSSKLGDIMEKCWREEEDKARRSKRKPSLLRVIIRVFSGRVFLLGCVLCTAEIVLKISQPLLLGHFIRYFSEGSTVSKEEAYLSAFGVLACSAITVFLVHPYMMGIMHVGMKIRIGCCSLIYRKALRLSKTALGNTTSGQVVNLLSNDVNRFDFSVIFLHYLWLGPLQTCVVLYLLWLQIGISSVIGVATLLVFIPLQAWLGKKTSQLRLKTALRTDERVRLMNEIISGIQVIKMYTWEKPFAKLVSNARKKEIHVIRGSAYIRGTLLSFIIFHSRLAIFCSIFAYVLFDNDITAERVFVVTSFFNVLRQTMTVFFPQGIGQVAEGFISIKRLQKFMMHDEAVLTLKARGTDSNMTNGGVTEELKPIMLNSQIQMSTDTMDNGIEIKKASAKWLPDLNEDTLNNISLRIEPGTLTAIIGTVGAGKTSLLLAILRELPLSKGNISVGGVISYASQEPWLFASSVRQNILFGSDYDKERYRQVVKVCSLRPDFDQFPYGDKTVVGERGVSLSGGQRARINLARAVYKEADIYLLDDPLSAVDTHVGKHLFDDCIKGYLKNKTCILITHQLQYLTDVKHIVFMENGKIHAEGNYQEVQQEAKDFIKMIASEQELSITEPGSNLHKRQSSIQSIASSYDEGKGDEPPRVEEMRSHGTVDSRVYSSYLKAGGNCCVLLFVVFTMVLTQLLASGGDYWITYWVNLEEYNQRQPRLPVAHPLVMPTPNSTSPTLSTVADGPVGLPFPITRDMCLYVFSVLTCATVFVTLFRSYLFFYLCTRGSMRLHDRMFNAITRATMRFFNTNSSGQILNRFSKDMGSIDEVLPGALIDCLQIGLTMIGIIIVVGVVNYLLMIPTIVIAILFYNLRSFYLSTSRSIKRLEGVTRSPVFSHLNASLQGLTTIRAFEAQTILEKEFDNHQDLHSSAFYLFISSSRAFGLWLDVICLCYIGFVTFSFLFLDLGGTFGGNVGLAITQAVGLTGMVQWGMRQSAELENQMTSVERVLEYTTLEQEPSLESDPDKAPLDTWPENGRVEFSKVFMGYSPDEPPVLKNLNFIVEPKEKVGIVGRTGAGKSSLIAVLFRLQNIQGDVIIDDVKTSTIGLHDLRSKISIIPQEPVLFSGTVRKNLDPFDEYSDYILWSALEEVELKEVVNELPGGLNSKMSEGGSNFSVGQRQLVCLARAIVRNNKILVMDEATANVDPQTDALIQSTIRRKFAECTVLTIAHRLHTVMDSDKVLVMGSGSVIEYNHPYILLQDKMGAFYKMVEMTGKVSADTLHKIAFANYQKKKTAV